MSKNVLTNKKTQIVGVWKSHLNIILGVQKYATIYLTLRVK